MKKLLFSMALLCAGYAYADVIDVYSETFNAADYVEYKPVKQGSTLTYFNENQNWQANHNKVNGYIICGEINGVVYSISTEALTFETVYRKKTYTNNVLVATEANYSGENGSIYLPIPKNGEAISHNHREFYIGVYTETVTVDGVETEVERNYFWTMVDGEIKYLVTDITNTTYSLMLVSKEEADANPQYVYGLNPNVGGAQTGGGGGNGGSETNSAPRRIPAMADVATLKFSGNNIYVYNDGESSPFFYAYATPYGIEGKNGRALLYASEAGMTTGVENVAEEAADVPAEYYNLQGVRVENPSNGIYIVRKGNTTKKVMMK